MMAHTLAQAGLRTVIVLEEGRRWAVDELRTSHLIDLKPAYTTAPGGPPSRSRWYDRRC